MKKELIKIRDRRNKEWFIIDNAYLNGYAKIFGAVGTAIYISLCRHANNETQECFPSQELIAKELGITDRTVRNYIKKFEEWNLILVKKEKNPKTQKYLNNVYTLLDKSQWKKKPEEIISYDSPEENKNKNQRKIVPHKNTYIINNTNKIQDELKNNSNALLNLFYKEINPNIKFNNKTTRTDAEWLENKYGIEKLEPMVMYIKQHQHEQYFPSISTPTQLREKMAQLINYSKKQNNKQSIIIKI
ncbi:MAG: helix-turn-helix domain-containing protein [Candidatus Pacebacteria bacterium]|nr:helix-turn-helix domain-containing protein [Candidatus Paceibacterota bacterium]